MNALIKIACALALVALVAAVSPPILAQWPAYPTYPVPKTAGGEPDLNAPAPRTPDGKPDFTGVWRGAPTGQRGAPPPVATTGIPLATFRDVGSTFKDGLPLKPYGAELLKKRIAGNSKDNPEAYCLPMGIMQFHTQGMPAQVHPDAEADGDSLRGQLRHPADLHRRPAAASEHRSATVVLRLFEPAGGRATRWSSRRTTCATTDGSTSSGRPLTDEAKLIERFRRVNYGRMEIDITVDDPKAYTKPWTVRHLQVIMPDGEIIEFICEENNRFPAAVGAR